MITVPKPISLNQANLAEENYGGESPYGTSIYLYIYIYIYICIIYILGL